jgi:hypothetical protein
MAGLLSRLKMPGIALFAKDEHHGHTSLHVAGTSCPRCPRSISACPRFPWGQTIRASIGFAGDFEFAPAAPAFKTPTPKIEALANRLATATQTPPIKVLPRTCVPTGRNEREIALVGTNFER